MAQFFNILITETMPMVNMRNLNQNIGGQRCDQEKTYPLNPNFTLRNALRTGNLDMFAYILDLGCPFFDSKRFDDTFETILEDILKDSESLLGNRKEQYLVTLFQS